MMNVSGTNGCTPLKQQNLDNTPSFGDHNWEDVDSNKNTIKELDTFIGCTRGEKKKAKVSPFEAFATILGIGATSAISAGFLAKKGMRLFSKMGVTEGLEKAALTGFKKVESKLGEINVPEGAKFAKIKNNAVDVAKKGLGGIKKFATFGINPEKLAETTAEAKVENAVLNVVSLGAGVGAGVEATKTAAKDKDTDGIADMFEQNKKKAISSISLMDIQ